MGVGVATAAAGSTPRLAALNTSTGSGRRHAVRSGARAPRQAVPRRAPWAWGHLGRPPGCAAARRAPAGASPAPATAAGGQAERTRLAHTSLCCELRPDPPRRHPGARQPQQTRQRGAHQAPAPPRATASSCIALVSEAASCHEPPGSGSSDWGPQRLLTVRTSALHAPATCQPSNPSALMASTLHAAIAAHRFGLGGRPRHAGGTDPGAGCANRSARPMQRGEDDHHRTAVELAREEQTSRRRNAAKGSASRRPAGRPLPQFDRRRCTLAPAHRGEQHAALRRAAAAVVLGQPLHRVARQRA